MSTSFTMWFHPLGQIFNCESDTLKNKVFGRKNLAGKTSAKIFSADFLGFRQKNLRILLSGELYNLKYLFIPSSLGPSRMYIYSDPPFSDPLSPCMRVLCYTWLFPFLKIPLPLDIYYPIHFMNLSPPLLLTPPPPPPPW